jgi:hypothetical protein
VSKIFRAALPALTSRKSDRQYRWYLYHHI